MLAVPAEIQARFDAVLIKSVPVQHRFYYKKWLRYYPDFCHKYRHPASEQQSLFQAFYLINTQFRYFGNFTYIQLP